MPGYFWLYAHNKGGVKLNDKRKKNGQFRKGNNGKLGFKHSLESKKKMSRSAWEGGRTRRHGYVLVYIPTHPSAVCGYVREHRVIMEAHIGRYLKPEERVHHVNGIKDDNGIENLKLLKNEAEHAKIHNNFGRIKSCV